MSRLYPRQRQVVELLIKGFSLKEIADKMGITRAAASVYAMRARRRLNFRSTEQMMFELGRDGRPESFTQVFGCLIG
jgi:DNA-binding CsgD family transcriptional regulator